MAIYKTNIEKSDKRMFDDNKHIPTSEILQDIEETEEEIKGYRILSKAEPNTCRINNMKISVRTGFIRRLNRILELRKAQLPEPIKPTSNNDDFNDKSVPYRHIENTS